MSVKQNQISVVQACPSSFFESTHDYQNWVVKNDGEHLWSMICPSMKHEQDCFSFTCNGQLVGVMAIGCFHVNDEELASIRFHINAVIAHKDYRNRVVSDVFIDTAISYSQLKCDDLIFEGYRLTEPMLDCTPTTKASLGFCERFNEAFAQRISIQ